jgi:hypothetical protein
MTQRPACQSPALVPGSFPRSIPHAEAVCRGKKALPDLLFQLSLADCSNTARCNPGKKRDALISKRLLIAVAISTSVSEKPRCSSTCPPADLHILMRPPFETIISHSPARL